MFERFSPSGRQVIVLAQDEARRFNHNYIGTEHLLLGLLAEPEGVARRALLAAGVTLDDARTRVQTAVGRGKRPPSGHIPFTPSAKKVLELALREALSLHHDYIGTEHLLLGLIREREGLGARLLIESGIDLLSLRMKVVDLVPSAAAAETHRRPFWARSRHDLPVRAEASDVLRTTTATDSSLDEARRLAGAGAVGSHHLLLATLSDSTSAAAKALGSLGIDLDQARSALREVDVAGTTDELPEEAGRRQLVMRVTGSTLVMETTDPTLLVQAQGILASSGGHEIRGDDARSRGFAEIWRAWQASLQATAERADEASAAGTAAD
ncbi:MAG TPA: Clp protease N-terminal domain-containing protein [Acidothermaceae bacterium]|nr:Clp protease N-terminal domain-containing protein [Acidothermaceae bacterium]